MLFPFRFFTFQFLSKNNVYNNVFTTTTTARVSTTTASTSALTTKTTTPIKSITDSNFRIAESSQTSLNSFIYSTLKTLQKEFIIDKMKITDLLNILTSQSDINDCLTNCSNNGKCNHDSILDKFFCVCNENYFGSSCKIDLRPCSSNPCLNNGTCSNIKGDKTLNYECQCYGDYYSGRNCEVKIDVCLNETCSNKGQCFDLNHTPKCKCFSMYSGDRCEIESNNLKIIKNVIKLSSIIAIIILNIFYGLCLISDITSAFCNAKKMNRKKNKNDPENINYKRYKFVYIN
ncbi:unnamed protein product [Brachionus calyciflorus]|uniref:EGF-like domain-containing protein n=1 Tax=Brachionus calyciflorus TaxID=104777 RepID=A0A813WNG5_9BILA|nr:unnamed protein product [Brachionus calyciflorus]